jgi:hypothetical protein
MIVFTEFMEASALWTNNFYLLSISLSAFSCPHNALSLPVPSSPPIPLVCLRHVTPRTVSSSSSSWMALQPLWALASFQFPDLFFYNRQDSLNEWSAHRKASTETLDGEWPIILLKGPLGAWGPLTCSKFTTRVKQLKVPPGGLVPWIVPSLKIQRPSRRSSHEVGTLPLDYGGRSTNCLLTLKYANVVRLRKVILKS